MTKTFTLLTTLAAIAFVSPALANEVQQDKLDIQADISAIHKDNIALKNDHHTLDRDRAAKAADKANDNNGKQAADSTRIGAVQSAIAEKEAERKVDREKLAHDQRELTEDRAKAESASNQ